ncbi:MAG: hypothetical protein ACJ739_13020 [Acidimicrobiales bacterium]
MPKPADALVTRVRERAAREPAFATVLEAILDAPPAETRELAHGAARQVNDVRRGQALAEFRDGALSTAEVRDRLGRSSAQSVHVLRSRGQLIGRTIGNATWFPAWQLQGGALREDLPRLLQALARFSDDAVAADRIMRLRRDELGGRSLAAALDDPKRAATAWNLLGALGG